MLSREPKKKNCNSQIQESNYKIEIWENVKLESGKKLPNEVVQVLNDDVKSINNSKASTSALDGYFLSLASKKFILLMIIILSVMMVVLILIIVQYVMCYRSI